MHQNGSTTTRRMTFSIIIFSIMTKLQNATLNTNDTPVEDIQHKFILHVAIVIILLSVFMLSVIMLSVITLIVVMLSVIRLSVIMLSVVKLRWKRQMPVILWNDNVWVIWLKSFAFVWCRIPHKNVLWCLCCKDFRLCCSKLACFLVLAASYNCWLG